MGKNALIALGGGPSPVINASLLGVFDSCSECYEIATVYGAVHGIEGLLKEELIDLSAQSKQEMSKLRYTPASGAIGTCRYKLRFDADEDYERIVDVFIKHDIGYFFYIGGNDSMDTAHKVSDLAQKRGIELVVAGVPKTIDNDLGDEERTIIDHTPGYGSTARYWSMLIKDVAEESRGMYVSESVSVFQAMGRKSGFITAAARLADPERKMPLQMYFAETGFGIEELYTNVKNSVSENGRCIVIVNEGFDAGEISAEKDGFGHTEYGASAAAAQLVTAALNKRGLPARGLSTWQMPGVLQRCTSIFISKTDNDEAYGVGRYAVEMALKEGTGKMATILRDYSVSTYKVYYDSVDLEIVANSERFLPPEWITPDGIDVTDAFIDYALPLIGEEMFTIPLKGGLQDFAQLDRKIKDKKLPEYLPVNFR